MVSGETQLKNYKIPGWFPVLFPQYICRIKTREPRILLTFDDGPTPGITEKVLDVLDTAGVSACFFMSGIQVERHPKIAREILHRGHIAGSHGYRHLDAWKTLPWRWNADVQQGHTLIEDILGQTVHYFRPPYGHVIPGVSRIPASAQAMLWDVMPGDFEAGVSAETLINRTLHAVQAGSILVLHDGAKQGSKMLEALQGIVEGLQQAGYGFVGGGELDVSLPVIKFYP
jgi:peptidoglycan-N-acetylglucosamine deacetylase